MNQLEIEDSGSCTRIPATGGAVWSTYAEHYRKRYGVEPLRNAKVNSQCQQLAKQLGERAAAVVAYFLTRGDAFYVHSAHPIGVCLQQAQKLCTEMTRGNILTMTAARRMEREEETDRVIREYIRHQGGEDNGAETLSLGPGGTR